MYIKYLRYLIRHKWFVALQCFREGLYWRGIKHDWSKFLPDEFIPYAKYFYGVNNPAKVDKDFDLAWLKHQHRNPHHWQHYVLREDSGNTKLVKMYYEDAIEMCCDWVGAGRAIHGKYDYYDPYRYAREWYKDNKEKILLNNYTRMVVERKLFGDLLLP